jgi:hypothetical protein
MNIEERLPIERLKLINRMDYALFKKLTPKCKTETERKIYFKMIKGYIKDHIKTKGIKKAIYKYTDLTPAGESGRLYDGYSIQSISRDIRGYLCNGNTTDIDCVNCHPVILEYLCKKYNISCAYLSEYNNDRQRIWNIIGENKDICKETILKITNSSWKCKTRCDWLKNYDKEIKRIQVELILIDELKHIWSCTPVKQYNFLGSNMNRVLCHFENKILNLIIDHLNIKNYEVMALMFDGCMIYGNHYNNTTLLPELEEVIKEYNIKLSFKQHSTSLTDEELKLLPDEEDEDIDELECSRQLIKDYPYWKCFQNQLWVYDELSGLWTNNTITQKRIIIDYGRGIKPRTDAGRSSILNTIISICPFDKNWKSNSNHCLLFNNGYYDSKIDIFYKDFNPNIIFFNKINQDWIIGETNYLNSIYNRLFIQPLGLEVGEYFLEQLARGLFCDNPKRILFGLGEPGAGKSVLAKAITNACGEYIGTFNAENLAFNKGSSDEASQMRWMMLLKNCRIIFSNELKKDVELNANSIKKLTGRDNLVARTHCAEETTFYVDYLPVVFANDIPKIKDYDEATDNRLRIASYTKKYVTEPKNDDELLEDPCIKEEIETDLFKTTLLQLLVNSYKKFKNKECITPQAVINSKKDWGIETTDIISVFLQDFTLTNNEEDYIESKDIIEWLKGKDITITKFGREMNKYCLKNNLDLVKSKNKKISGKSSTCWVGIKS